MLAAATLFSNRKERTGRLLPISLRLGFSLVNHSIDTRAVFGKRAPSPARRPSHHWWDQKTFSAGPRSFNSKELWFLGNRTASQGQPVSDSRHGRITCKASLSCIKRNRKENRRCQSHLRALGPTPSPAGGDSQNSTRVHHLSSKLARAAASNQTAGLKVQPLYWLAATLRIHCAFIVWVRTDENRRRQSTHRAQGPTPLQAGGGSLNDFCFFWFVWFCSLAGNSGNIRWAS